MQITVDTKDKQCPAPLILTKEAITKNEPGCEIKIVANNTTSKDNILTYLKELKINANHTEKKGIHTIIFTNPSKTDPKIIAKDYCTAKKTCTIVIKSEMMGEGDSTLGALLMRAFINSLPESEIIPDNMILYNSGVKTAVKDSDTANTYIKLQSKGVNIIVCGTCIDYYKLKESLAVGEISNMYKITEVLTNSDTVIYP